MYKRGSTHAVKIVLISTFAICLSGVQAKASTPDPVFMWAVDGTTLVGLNSGGTAVSGATFNASTIGSGVNFFSLAVAGSINNQNIFVADPGAHTLYELNWSWSTNGQGSGTLSKNNTIFSFVPDTSGGGISPQEIALDASGNLWTTSFDGQIYEYTTSCQGGTNCAGTQIFTNATGIPGARGIAIIGGTAYVTVQGSYGSGSVDTFSASGSLNPAVTQYSALGASTTGQTPNHETGQMRGVTGDEGGNIYYVDSTWGPTGAGDGYICEVPTGTGGAGSMCSYSTSFLHTTVLNGPNEIISGQGSGATGAAFGTGCDDLYVANYFGNNITEIGTGLTTGGTVSSSCGTAATTTTFATSAVFGATGAHVTGLALTPNQVAVIGGNQGPTNLFGPDFSQVTPEPGTWVLMLSALFGVAGTQVWRRRRAAKA